MNPDGGAVPQTFKIASPDDKKSPSEPVAGEPATVALPKMGENPIPPKAVASSKISSRILGLGPRLRGDERSVLFARLRTREPEGSIKMTQSANVNRRRERPTDTHPGAGPVRFR